MGKWDDVGMDNKKIFVCQHSGKNESVCTFVSSVSYPVIVDLTLFRQGITTREAAKTHQPKIYNKKYF